VGSLHPSPNFGERKDGVPPDILLLHYTGMHSCARAIGWLSTPKSNVSCHYVIDTDGAITQMVQEQDRAWHAGAGSWQGHTDINSRSIGIEIHNPGHDQGYPEFQDAQMDAVIALSRDIIARNAIPAAHVLAHSDIAPARKIDPGEKLDWARLAAAGIGHWVEPSPIDPFDEGLGRDATEALVGDVQRQLAAYGFGIMASGVLDAPSMIVVRAFQRHFRPARVDGRLDRSTCDTLARLLAARPVA
jgi:N-acetylmuramoyl-L-alanine amidase